jgi:hypothetical protein
MAAINANVGLRSKKVSGASTSLVWQYFGYKEDENDNDLPTCKLCLRKVRAAGGNTSNLRRHIKDHHPVESSKIAKTKPDKRRADTANAGQSSESTSQRQQLSITDAFSKLQKYERGGKQWQKLTNSVTKCLAKDMMPIYTVEKSGFQQLLKDFDPKYQLPSRKYFSQQAIPKLYNETRESILQQLQSTEFFSATSDMWSSNTMEPYMSYTVHFIDPDWKLQSRCLQTLYAPADHTAETLADGMKEILEYWHLSSTRQVCITTDSGANVVKAVRDLDWPWMSCFGHNLHLAITNAMKDENRISRAIGVCKRIVTAFSQSWKRRRELSKTQLELELPVKSLVSVNNSCKILHVYYDNYNL